SRAGARDRRPGVRGREPGAQAEGRPRARAACHDASLPRAVRAHRAAPGRERPEPVAIPPRGDGRAVGGSEAARTRARTRAPRRRDPGRGEAMTETTTDKGREA